MAVTTAQGNCGFRIANFGLHNPQSAIHTPQCARRGQSIIEYAVLTAIVAAALGAMAVYGKRALSGNWRSAADTFGYGRQYEPRQPSDPPLGSVWEENEGERGQWDGTWVLGGGRCDPATYNFDAGWIDRERRQPPVTACLIIRREGNTISVTRERSSDDNNCTYTGTISGNRVTGTYTCSGNCRGGCNWRATIR